MIDDMDSLIRYVLLMRIEGYEFEGVFEHMRMGEETRWGVQVMKRQGDVCDIRTHISKFYVKYPRQDVENAIRDAIRELEIFLKSGEGQKETIEEQINRISNYYAEGIRLESLLRRMRAWYHRRIGS